MIIVDSVLCGCFFGTLLVFKALLCETQVWEQLLQASWARFLAVPQLCLPIIAHLAHSPCGARPPFDRMEILLGSLQTSPSKVSRPTILPDRVIISPWCNTHSAHSVLCFLEESRCFLRKLKTFTKGPRERSWQGFWQRHRERTVL